MGVNVYEQFANARTEVYTFRAQGSIYHQIGSLLPTARTRPRFLQIYIYDTEHQIDNRMLENNGLNRQVVEKTKHVLDQYNPFVHMFRHISHRQDLNTCKLIIREQPSTHRQYSLPTISQVAAVFINGVDSDAINGRDIVVQTTSGQLINVQDDAGYYDPLQYPLLLPHGSYGWDINSRNENGTACTCRDLYAYMLQLTTMSRLRHIDLGGCKAINKLLEQSYIKNCKTHLHRVNFMLEKLVRWSRTWRSKTKTDVLERTNKVMVLGGGLAVHISQQGFRAQHAEDHVSDHSSSIEESHSNDAWICLVEETIASAEELRALKRDLASSRLSSSVEACNRNGDSKSSVYRALVKQRIPHDMHQRYQDAMALVQKYEKSDIFLTMTCNPSWDEITSELFPCQTPQDGPDLLTRIFRSKYEHLKKDIYNTRVLGKTIAHVHVIEFQKWGLPHCHMLIILEESNKLNTPDDYDRIVKVEIPYREEEPELYNIVLKHMIHGPCRALNPNSPCMKNGSCKKAFPKQFFEVTVQGNDCYPVYMRCNDGRYVALDQNIEVEIDNKWVVPSHGYY
ncbi:hypothetical protein FF2_000799 [Malus domestica]